ncbi:MAG: hypothetical protein ACRDEA_03915, partial [Microcystaceae cyanobacterium]
MVESTSPYALTAIASSEHFDVIEGDEHLGRLYVFPVTDLELVAQGISQQWFLTHQQGDCLICGHVKGAQEWSLCQPHSLEPTEQYFSQEDLLALVFSPGSV